MVQQIMKFVFECDVIMIYCFAETYNVHQTISVKVAHVVRLSISTLYTQDVNRGR
jgi:hypothetical protein